MGFLVGDRSPALAALQSRDMHLSAQSLRLHLSPLLFYPRYILRTSYLYLLLHAK